MIPIRPAAALAAALLVSACAVGPRYQAPTVAPPTFQNADPQAFAVGAAPEASWWRAFQDPTLDDLVARALAGNLDLRIAGDRVRQARALFRDAELDFAPRVTSRAGYAASKQQQPGFSDQPTHVESYQAGFDAAWEIDLFGRVRHSVEAAKADAQAARSDLRDAQVAVAAEVARNYFELRGAQVRLAVARRNLDTQRETLRLTQVRFDVGRGDAVDVASAQARLNATEAQIPTLIAAEKRANYRLAVLLGQRPGALDEALKARDAATPPLLRALPIGDAAELLRRRPDVQAAERRLAGESARAGVATADLFPRVRVSGFIGFLSGDFSSLTDARGRAWSVAPTVSWPALDLGGARARLRAQQASADAALAAYDQTVLRALEDLETALVAYRQQQAEVASLTDQAAASRRAAELARIQYKEGRIDFLVLLDAERTLLAAEDGLSVAETGVNTAVVAVYKALGGGWTA